MTCAEPASPMRPSASAARPRTSAEASCSAARRGSTADTWPMSPMAKAAICRTSASRSPASTAASGATPSASPARPTAWAARRRTRPSGSCSSRTRSGVGGGAGGACLPRRPFAAADGAVSDGGRRHGRAEDALVLESAGSTPSSARRSSAPPAQAGLRRGRTRGQQHEKSGQACRARHHRCISRRRIVARSTRSSTTRTPMPGPSGTGIVPSGPTSIGGSMRSGS